MAVAKWFWSLYDLIKQTPSISWKLERCPAIWEMLIVLMLHWSEIKINFPVLFWLSKQFKFGSFWSCGINSPWLIVWTHWQQWYEESVWISSIENRVFFVWNIIWTGQGVRCSTVVLNCLSWIQFSRPWLNLRCVCKRYLSCAFIVHLRSAGVLQLQGSTPYEPGVMISMFWFSDCLDIFQWYIADNLKMGTLVPGS